MSKLFIKIAQNLGLLQSRKAANAKMMKLRLSTTGRARVPNNVMVEKLGTTKIHGRYSSKRLAG